MKLISRQKNSIIQISEINLLARYPELDVYKRQSLHRADYHPGKAVTEKLPPVMAFVTGGVCRKGEKRCAYRSCLLYTSRCV